MARLNELGRLITITFVSGILTSFAANTTSFGQAGSTGGSVGKQDKSMSGNEEAPSSFPTAGKKQPTRPAKPNEGTRSACGEFPADIVGIWNSTSPSPASEDIRRTGCGFLATISNPIFHHAVSGRYLGRSNFSLTIERTNQITGCATVMLGSMTVISGAQMQWVITGTDGKCDLSANYTETRMWAR